MKSHSQHPSNNDTLAMGAVVVVGGLWIALGGLVHVAAYLSSGQSPASGSAKSSQPSRGSPSR